MNIVVLMAGGSESFQEAGFAYPKNLVEIHGQALVQRVIEGLAPLLYPGNRLVCLVRREENRQYHTGEVIRLLVPDAEVIEVPATTAGAACTALLAIETVNTDEPLLLVNGDQIVDENLRAIVHGFEKRRLDGGVVVFEAVHPRWSYVKC